MKLKPILLLPLVCLSSLVCSNPPPDTIRCSSASTNCTITNAYGAFPDRAICRAASVTYPTTEEELVAAVAAAAAANKTMKSVSRTVHSIPKLSCPGGDNGILISTKHLNRVVSVDRKRMVITVEAGMMLKELIEVAAEVGLVLPHGPYWWGITLGGLLATGAHGSSLWGKGGAVHEYVVGIRIVTPASSEEGYAQVRSIDAENSHLDAVKVSLGVLGVISQVTFQLQPIFKRSISYVTKDKANIADRAVAFGNEHEFAHIEWQLSIGKVIYRIDDRVPNNVSGNGSNDFLGFRPTPTTTVVTSRLTEERLEETSSSKCAAAALNHYYVTGAAQGLTNNGLLFTGYPVVGYQNELQASGSCLIDTEDDLLTVCLWDPRVRGQFIHQTTISIALSQARNFILDIQKLRDFNPDAFCGVDLYGGILIRYVKASTAHMGKPEDSLDFDFTYYRSHDASAPRLHEDVLEEVEQMALYKYGGLPHWGKNRNLAFDGVIWRFGWRREEFLRVKNLYDPRGLFSNEWTDQVLGIKGATSVYKAGCALEGLCVCAEDMHCAPHKGYFCRPGKVYIDARVCSRERISYVM